MLVYLRQSGWSIRDHIAEAQCKRPPHETGIGAQILCDLGLRTIRLLTNHARRVSGLEAYGLKIVSQGPV